MSKRILRILLLMLGVGMMTSCSSVKNIVYLQDIQPNVSIMTQKPELIKFEPGDQLRIIVHSRDAEVSRIFNLLDHSGQGNGRHALYTIDEMGFIDMPILGRIKISGLTREETINEIKYLLLDSRMVKDPVITIEYDGLTYSVLGEIKSPGRKEITHDKLTLLDAIANAGDLTIDGRRDNILVLRTKNGVQTPYRVNILDTKSLYSSPVYYIQQNDIIYIEPNNKKTNTSTVNGNTLLTPGFWMSATSFVLSLIFLLVK